MRARVGGWAHAKVGPRIRRVCGGFVWCVDACMGVWVRGCVHAWAGAWVRGSAHACADAWVRGWVHA